MDADDLQRLVHDGLFRFIPDAIDGLFDLLLEALDKFLVGIDKTLLGFYFSDNRSLNVNLWQRNINSTNVTIIN